MSAPNSPFLTASNPAPHPLGMRAMQAKVWRRRGEQHLLIKAPPASGKSRALMFVALDKLRNQGCRQAIIAVPEKSIGASFGDTELAKFGFFADWHVAPKWNLCNAPGEHGGTTKSVAAFLESDDEVLVCTHATFRFAVAELGVEAFDNRLIAIDEFHHVSANPENVLGAQLRELIARDETHIVAMTGSYFRGDSEAVLLPADEDKFASVTFTYAEQLAGYTHLKHVDVGYFFYQGDYTETIAKVLDPELKTIVHIPHVGSRESTGDKLNEVNAIQGMLGAWEGVDEATGFQLVRQAEGGLLRVADLVDDDANKRGKVLAALTDPAHKDNRDHVDIIIALGMAQEGFDWIWCEHALTVGYRASLTQIVQIIGRATRDAPGKARARFTNLIAEPDASDESVNEAINDTLKAISASLMMEQVMTPIVEFVPKHRPESTGKAGPSASSDEVIYPKPNGTTDAGGAAEPGAAQYEMIVDGVAAFETPQARQRTFDHMQELMADLVQDTRNIAKPVFDRDHNPEEFAHTVVPAIVRTRFPDMSEQDIKAATDQVAGNFAIAQAAREGRTLLDKDSGASMSASTHNDVTTGSTAFVDGVKRYLTDVTELDIDLIERIDPFGTSRSIIARSMSETMLNEIGSIISARRSHMTLDEARDYARAAMGFKAKFDRLPSPTAADPYERRMAEGIAVVKNRVAADKRAQQAPGTSREQQS